jgi:hypothetical protein
LTFDILRFAFPWFCGSLFYIVASCRAARFAQEIRKLNIKKQITNND